MSAPPGRIDLIGLRHSFGRHGPPALVDITLSVAAGQAVALVGRSGCGKSTLLHIIAGLLRPSAGEVRISGRPVTAPSAKWTMMFQTPSLFPWMTAAENIGLGLRYAHRPAAEVKDRVEELLALVHLSEHKNDNVQQLSGGQQQRVALARSPNTVAKLIGDHGAVLSLANVCFRAMEAPRNGTLPKLGTKLICIGMSLRAADPLILDVVTSHTPLSPDAGSYIHNCK